MSRTLVVVVAMAVLAGACGDGGDDRGEEPDGATTATAAPSAAATTSDREVAATPSEVDGAEPTDGAVDGATRGRGTWADLAPVPDGTDWRTLDGVWAGDAFLLLGVRAEGRVELLELDPGDDAWRPRATLVADVSPWELVARWADDRLLLLAPPAADHDPAAPTRERPLVLHVWDPAVDRWSRVSTPLGERHGHSATWTGEQLVVFGGLVEVAADDGSRRNETLASGAAWDPVSEEWTALGAFPHEGRSSHAAVWNGRRLVAFGGGHASGRFEAEGEYPWDRSATGAAAWNPTTNAWTSIAGPGPVGPVVAATWTGTHVVWWDGSVQGWDVDDEPGAGGVWDTDTGAIEPLPSPPLSMRRDHAPAVWAAELDAWITWGGSCGEGCNQAADDGALWDAASNTWSLLADADLGRRSAPIAWTGSELLVVAGAVSDQEAQVFEERADGARWRP